MNEKEFQQMCDRLGFNVHTHGANRQMEVQLGSGIFLTFDKESENIKLEVRGVYFDSLYEKILRNVKRFAEEEITLDRSPVAIERTRILDAIRKQERGRFKLGETNSRVVLKACKDIVKGISKW